ncbi:MAG: uroporphyrinogen decarboxylase [Candidatus Dormiibacterota bacterium]
MTTSEERFLAACRRQDVDTTPVWFMRQAGRCLAEYRELREKYDILTMTRTPELCAQVTMMPVEKFGVDAAVLYADIMLPLEGMGVPFQIDPGVGPIIPNPVRTAEDVARLRVIDAEEATPYLFETIRGLRHQLAGKTALIGFAGAPFTVASYMIEGRPTKDFGKAKALMYGQPGVWHELMETLAEVTTRYLKAQVEAGVQVVQLFDSWVGALGRLEYEAYVLPHTRRIFQGLNDLLVPLIHFGTGATHLLEPMARAGCDIVSVDWRLPLDQAWDRIGRDRGIQGNLDPTVLVAPWPVIEREARRVLEFAGNENGHIFNLGHGVLADTPADNLTRLVELVHEVAARPEQPEPEITFASPTRPYQRLTLVQPATPGAQPAGETEPDAEHPESEGHQRELEPTEPEPVVQQPEPEATPTAEQWPRVRPAIVRPAPPGFGERWRGRESPEVDDASPPKPELPKP